MNENIRLQYNICFIRQGNRILMLNRVKPPNMGLWNGVGGKIEPHENPAGSVKREVYEETGIWLNNVCFAGLVTWEGFDATGSGMYVFLSELPEGTKLDLPLSTPEGILDWKPIEWILHPQNRGIVSNISYYLPFMLEGKLNLVHRFFYDQNGEIAQYLTQPLDAFLDSGSKPGQANGKIGLPADRPR